MQALLPESLVAQRRTQEPDDEGSAKTESRPNAVAAGDRQGSEHAEGLGLSRVSVKLLRLALQEAVRTGDTQTAKHLTAVLVSLLSNQAGASPVQTSIAIH
jgi:hypothetical protein